MSNPFTPWIGRRVEAAETLDGARAQALLAAVGRPRTLKPGDALPHLHHWLYFWEVIEPSGLGADGHPARGAFLPPTPQSRRMWAGGRLRFLQPLRVGEAARKVSTITGIETKTGRSGTLTFVTVLHEISGEQGLAVREEQDIVYRDPAPLGSASASASAPDAEEPDWRERILPDPVLMFRYSALTMNGHRIHYDHPYATREEGYAGLVVHGPLQATLLVDLARRHLSEPIAGFEFRGLAPAFDGAPLDLCANRDGTLWSAQAGRRTTAAKVIFGGDGRG